MSSWLKRLTKLLGISDLPRKARYSSSKIFLKYTFQSSSVVWISLGTLRNDNFFQRKSSASIFQINPTTIGIPWKVIVETTVSNEVFYLPSCQSLNEFTHILHLQANQSVHLLTITYIMMDYIITNVQIARFHEDFVPMYYLKVFSTCIKREIVYSSTSDMI